MSAIIKSKKVIESSSVTEFGKTNFAAMEQLSHVIGIATYFKL
ncbi:MAG: hypothetical protein ACRCWR_04840 [Saezia sp.]